jgi:hypothetical protein
MTASEALQRASPRGMTKEIMRSLQRDLRRAVKGFDQGSVGLRPARSSAARRLRASAA